MCRKIGPMTIISLFAVTSLVQAEDPKFAQLTTKKLFSATAPDLRGGIVFGGGDLHLSASPTAMILAEIKGPAFVHVKMNYQGEYTDPNTNIAGYLYHLKDGAYDRDLCLQARHRRNNR